MDEPGGGVLVLWRWWGECVKKSSGGFGEPWESKDGVPFDDPMY